MPIADARMERINPREKPPWYPDLVNPGTRLSNLLKIVPIVVPLMVLGGFLETSDASPELFDQLCATCHRDDSPTCAGCHNHRGELTAATDRVFYAPGQLVRVTLSGGTEPGWVRGILYDEEENEIDRAAGPTETGDDGSPADSVGFPVLLEAPAPLEAGTYTWRAAYYGVFHPVELTHDEEWTPVTVVVDTTTARSWGTVKAQFRSRWR